jgi:TonB family protein
MTSRLAPAVCVLILALAPRLTAQHVLLAEDNGKMEIVRAAKDLDPRVEEDGKLRTIPRGKFALVEVPEYLPAFVSIRDLTVRAAYNSNLHEGGEMNVRFYFNANFRTSYRLDDVFLVLDLVTERGDKSIFLREIGHLEPNETKPVSAIVPLESPLGAGHYHLYLFCGGQEVFQSKIPFQAQEAALDRMVAKRIEGVNASPPRPFFGPAPDYPDSLKSTNARGRVVIGLRIRANGAVRDPVVQSASDPAFGEAALAAVRMWRFLPAIKDGFPQETAVAIPIIFDPPNPG